MAILNERVDIPQNEMVIKYDIPSCIENPLFGILLA